jgi:hypothetical protein
MGKPYNKAIKQKVVKTTSRAIYCPPMPDRHMMIDIETLDVEVNAAIIAIGVRYRRHLPRHYQQAQ